MTMRSILPDTALIGTMDGKDKKGKLALVALALVGVIFLLRSRGDDSEETEESKAETESEYEDEEMKDEEKEESEDEAMEDEIEVETKEQIGGSAKEELVEARRDLDIFDMLAILAAAIKAARDEYRSRSEN